MIIRASTEFKNQCKEDASSFKYGNLYIKEDKKDITESDDLKDFKITSSCYVNDKFIGTTVAKKITGNILNDGQHNLEDKNIQVKTGIKIGENVEYQNLDTYIIPKPNSEEVNKKTQFTGYDYMIKFDIPYVDRVTYPIRLDNYLEDLCNQVKVVLGSKDFFNNDYMILGNPFTNNETCKVVLNNICQLALGFAVIEEEKLYIRNLDVNGESVETIDGNNYMDFSPNNVFGPVNSFKIQMNSGVEGEESVREEAGVTDGNRCQISISDNYFLNSQEQRELVIDKMFNAIKGLTYLPVKINYYGYPWLKLGDKIKVLDNNDKEYVTYVMEHVFEYNGSYSGTVESKAITKTQSTYKNTQNIKEWKRKTESAVDMINGKITQVVQETTENSNKITEHTQTIDEIKDSMSAIIDTTNTVKGVKTVYLGNCIEGDLLELHIYGNNTVFDYLRLSDNLTLSDDLILYGDSEIIVTDKDNNSKIYDLGIKDVLRQKGNICDEYILKEGKAQIIRRIDKDNGSIKTVEEIEELGIFNIPIKEGINTIAIKNYTADIEAKWVIKNEFTDTYATRVEMKSSIKQLAGEIELEATKKVDKAEFGTMIKQNWEAIKFAWNQISQYLKMEGIEGKATLNIYGENNNMLMSLSQDGQGFYDSMGNKIGTVGIVREENKDTLAFAMNVDWDTVDESKSMAWGYFDKNGKFLPIFHLIGTYGAENSEYGGHIAVEGNVQAESLEVLKNTIASGETAINLIDVHGNTLLSANSVTPYLNILNLITTSVNKDGCVRFDFSDCRFNNIRNVAKTDENLNYLAGSADGHIFASFKDGGSVIIFANSSDKKLKKNIKNSTEKALAKIMEIKHYEFDWKKDNKHQSIGYIAQEMEKIDSNFVYHTVHKLPNGEDEENWQINNLAILSNVTKAIQEQQEEIENLKKALIKRNQVIDDLETKIQRLEGQVNGV